MNIYVGNVAYNSTEEELKSLFEQYGPVNSVKVIMDKMTGRPKGFAFVEMATEEEGQAAVDALNGQDFGGRPLRVNKAKPREDRPARPRFGSRF